MGACGQWALWTQDFGRGGWGPRLCLGLLSPWGRAPGAVLPRRTLPLSRHPNYRINKSTLWDLEYTRSGQKMMKTSARAHARQRHALLQPARFPRVSSEHAFAVSVTSFRGSGEGPAPPCRCPPPPRAVCGCPGSTCYTGTPAPTVGTFSHLVLGTETLKHRGNPSSLPGPRGGPHVRPHAAGSWLPGGAHRGIETRGNTTETSEMHLVSDTDANSLNNLMWTRPEL